MKKRRSRVALVCAGGGVTGAVYEIGCLRALEDLLDRKLNDLDLYVGVSGGAFVASLLASGISASELFDGAVRRSSSGLGHGTPELFRLGLGGLLEHAREAPRVLRDALRTMVSADGGSLSDGALSLLELLPPGLLDNSGVRDYLAQVLEQRGQGLYFSNLDRELYVIAVDLDRGTAVAFGEEDLREVSIPLAVQASTALPGCTARCESAAGTSSTAASRRRPTSTKPSSTVRIWSSASIRSSPFSTMRRAAPWLGPSRRGA